MSSASVLSKGCHMKSKKKFIKVFFEDEKIVSLKHSF